MSPINSDPNSRNDHSVNDSQSKTMASKNLTAIANTTLSPNSQNLQRIQFPLSGASDDYLRFDGAYTELAEKAAGLERSFTRSVTNGDPIDLYMDPIRNLENELQKLSSMTGDKFPKLQEKIRHTKSILSSLKDISTIYIKSIELDLKLSELLKNHEYKDSLIDKANLLFNQYDQLLRVLNGRNIPLYLKIQKSLFEVMNFTEACINYKNLERLFTINNFENDGSLIKVRKMLISAAQFNLDSFIKFRLPRTELFLHFEKIIVEKSNLELRLADRQTEHDQLKLRQLSTFIRRVREFDVECQKNYGLPRLGFNDSIERRAIRQNQEAEELLKSLLQPQAVPISAPRPLPVPKVAPPLAIVKSESEISKDRLELKLKNRLVELLKLLPNEDAFNDHLDRLLYDPEASLVNIYIAGKQRVAFNPHLNNSKIERCFDDVEEYLEIFNSNEMNDARKKLEFAKEKEIERELAQEIENQVYSGLSEKYDTYFEMLNDPEASDFIRKHCLNNLKQQLAETNERIAANPDICSRKLRDLILKSENIINNPLKPDLDVPVAAAQPNQQSSYRIVRFLIAAALAIRELARKIHDKIFGKPIDGNRMTGAPYRPLEVVLNQVNESVESCA